MSKLIPPRFVTEPPRQHCIRVGENWSYTLPAHIRAFSDKFTKLHPDFLEDLEAHILVDVAGIIDYDKKTKTVSLVEQPARYWSIGVYRMRV